MLRISEHFQYYFNELDQIECIHNAFGEELISEFSVYSLFFKEDPNRACISVLKADKTIRIENSYYIGLGWLHPWNKAVIVEPKVNTERHKLDHLKMLTEALSEPENLHHLHDLIDIRFDEEWIEVEGDQVVQLTPFLIAQLLLTVRNIVRKGLKKDYYRVTENLQSKIKGKILVSQQIRQNLVRNRLTNTVCSYQEYGINTESNRFLKHVLKFISAQINNLKEPELKDILNDHLVYNLGAFQLVSDEKFYQCNQKEFNPLFKEYNVAIQLGNQLLKLMDHDLSKATNSIQKYPPHWIDMSKLFELYVFKKLREQYSGLNEVQYHFKTHSQELDFIINTPNRKAVVDAKYKPRYKSGNPSMDDARQLAGYARLNSVYRELGIKNDEMIDIYFVYPSELKGGINSVNENQEEDFVTVNDQDDLALFPNDIRESKAYRRMYMQEVDLPLT